MAKKKKKTPYRYRCTTCKRAYCLGGRPKFDHELIPGRTVARARRAANRSRWAGLPTVRCSCGAVWKGRYTLDNKIIETHRTRPGCLVTVDGTESADAVATPVDEALSDPSRQEIDQEPDRDAAYERAAARDRADGFSRTSGRDWT